MDVEKILTEGVFFKKAKSPKAAEEKVKTKAKKKTYITGLHGSGAAKMKAEEFCKMAENGIHEIELSTGKLCFFAKKIKPLFRGVDVLTKKQCSHPLHKIIEFLFLWTELFFHLM